MRRTLAILTTTAAAVCGLTGTATAKPVSELGSAEIAELVSLPCTAAGPTDGDANAAAVLNPRLGGTMRNALDAYNISCARAVVQAVKYRGLNEKAATIALATTIVETGNHNYNGGDRDSVGLFQQRDTWGSFAERTNPGIATNRFLDTMERFYPDGSWFTAPVGTVAADVQRPAAEYRGRYAEQAGDAAILARWLWNAEGDLSGDGYGDLTAIDATGRLTLYGNGLLRPDFGGKPYVGSYWQTQNTNWGDAAKSITTADVSGDRYADLLVLTNAGRLEIYGNVSGTGTPFTVAHHVYDNWADYENVAAGDVNNDGWADLAANTRTGQLHVFLNTRDPAAPFHGVTWVYSSGWGSDVLDIALGDVSGDSYADLVATRTNGTLTVFGNGLLNPSFGGKPYQGATWQAATGWNYVHDITLSKVNSDGYADLMAVTTSGQLQVYPNTRGTTPFTSAQWLYDNWAGVKQIA